MKTLLEYNIEKEAGLWSDQYEKGHPGHGEASEFKWTFHPAFPLSELGNPKNWSDWMKDELKWAEEDGFGYRYKSLMEDPKILEPVFIVQGVDGEYHIWDGHHRVGASFLRGFKTIPANVGIRL
ncbi:MAG: ParB N-terminal domain-containing protein [Candidatus Scalindua sp.]|jgi:hypothetical protein|nr:ParB N-terminal domain-containing protein [Candidatus Scalindua sp.]